MIQKNARIQDVAKKAGVSTATVSRALSHPELLTEATRESVFAAIRSTGYRVNKTARSLRTQKAGAVLVLVPNLGNPFFSQILSGISETFGEQDCSVLIADSKDHAAKGKPIVDYFLDSPVDGLICLDGALPKSEFDRLKDSNVGGPAIFACEWVKGVNLPSVRSDNVQGARLAVQHLHALGHRKIAHVTGPQDNVLTHARREGMLSERARLALPARDEWIIRGDFSLESGQVAAEKILRMQEKPTAVFCASDQVAFGLMSTLIRNGIRVPEDMSVVGFDDIELSEFYVPALTTIRQDRHALGARAAMLLNECISSGTPPEDGYGTQILVDVELVIRKSACPVERSSPNCS